MPPLSVIVASIVINALFLEPVNPLSMTIMQERVPSGMRGRVFGAMAAIGATTLPLGMITYGSLADALGLRPTLLILASANLALPVSMLLLPGFRTLSRPQRQATVAP